MIMWRRDGDAMYITIYRFIGLLSFPSSSPIYPLKSHSRYCIISAVVETALLLTRRSLSMVYWVCCTVPMHLGCTFRVLGRLGEMRWVVKRCYLFFLVVTMEA